MRRQRSCFYYEWNFHRMREFTHWTLTVRHMSVDSWVAHVVVFPLTRRDTALTSSKLFNFSAK